VIDLHAHVLPGVDDGPPDLDAAVALVRAAHAAGTTTIVATSHVSERYPNRAESLARAREALVGALAAAGVDVRIEPGAEIATGVLGELGPDELAALRLGGGPWLLIESPLSSSAGDFELLLEPLWAAGHRIVLAHPERCPAFQREPVRLERLVARGALVSITAAALTGRFGTTVARYCDRLLRDGLVHNVASDAHGSGDRGPEIAPHIEAAAEGLDGMAEAAPWFTEEVPEAILTGAPIGGAPVLSERRAPAWRRLSGSWRFRSR